MRSVSIEGGKVLVSLNCAFYSRKAIEAAARQFCGVGDSQIEKKGNFFCVSIAPKSKDLCSRETGLLFCNFALAAMQTM